MHLFLRNIIQVSSQPSSQARKSVFIEYLVVTSGFFMDMFPHDSEKLLLSRSVFVFRFAILLVCCLRTQHNHLQLFGAILSL